VSALNIPCDRRFIVTQQLTEAIFFCDTTNKARAAEGADKKSAINFYFNTAIERRKQGNQRGDKKERNQEVRVGTNSVA
jgi:hypothetical protein